MTVHRRPKELGTVVRCHDNAWDGLCVDIFRRTDGTFGFQQYRRDPESNEGWFPLGSTADYRFDTIDEAVERASRAVVWLREQFGESRHGL